jgi:hypothetical protein
MVYFAQPGHLLAILHPLINKSKKTDAVLWIDLKLQLLADGWMEAL